MMSFGAAIQRNFQKYATFSGRARRPEYWYFVLFNLLLSIVTGVIDGVTGLPVVGLVVSLALLLPGLAVTWRRMHDLGRTGWTIFLPLAGAILFVPGIFLAESGSQDIAQIVFIVAGVVTAGLYIYIIVLLASRGEEQANRFGPPLDASGNEITDAEVFA